MTDDLIVMQVEDALAGRRRQIVVVESKRDLPQQYVLEGTIAGVRRAPCSKPAPYVFHEGAWQYIGGELTANITVYGPKGPMHLVAGDILNLTIDEPE
jgi:hypothetical protein